MALSAFADKAHQPTNEDLRVALGPAHDAWNALIEAVAASIPQLDQIWGCTSKSTGWGLRLRHKERVILYMTPSTGHFLVSFVLGEKAVKQARSARLSKALLSAIEAAPRYAEGRGVRVTVSNRGQVASLASLAVIKHQN